MASTQTLNFEAIAKLKAQGETLGDDMKSILGGGIASLSEVASQINSPKMIKEVESLGVASEELVKLAASLGDSFVKLSKEYEKAQEILG